MPVKVASGVLRSSTMEAAMASAIATFEKILTAQIEFQAKVEPIKAGGKAATQQY